MSILNGRTWIKMVEYMYEGFYGILKRCKDLSKHIKTDMTELMWVAKVTRSKSKRVEKWQRRNIKNST